MKECTASNRTFHLRGLVQIFRKQTIKNERGIALFMVLASIGMLSVLVTEFTYLAQINQKLAYDRMDHLKAVYLAKSAYKLSLLRLKAYKTIKDFTDNKKLPIQLPKKLIDMVWTFPLLYPLPTGLPGMTPSQKERMEKFNEESSLEGNFTSQIFSESSKLNLNMLLARYTPNEKKKKKGSGNSSGNNNDPKTSKSPNPDKKNTFKPEAARQSLKDFLTELMKKKFLSDDDFASEYQNFNLTDLVDNIYAWVDPKYERALGYREDRPTRKGAAFYSIDELHMVPGINDDLYQLFAPHLTTQVTPGININKIDSSMLKTLFPQFLEEEITEFFEFRDSIENDNQFKSVEDFYKYLSTNIASYRGGSSLIDEVKANFKKRNINLVVDEEVFNIKIRSNVNTAVVNLNAVVIISDTGDKTKKNINLPGDDLSNPRTRTKKNAGLKVTYYRII